MTKTLAGASPVDQPVRPREVPLPCVLEQITHAVRRMTPNAGANSAPLDAGSEK